MDSKLHQELLENTEHLRNLVGLSSTESVVGMSATYFLSGLASDEEFAPLMSPAKQIFFLMGLMLTTPEPEHPKEFGSQEWQQSIELLNSIFNAYAVMFWPKPEEAPNLTQKWKDVRRVAMPAFLHYFNIVMLASVEQISDRIKLYLSPFNEELKSSLGISPSEALVITDWIAESLQKLGNRLQRAAKEEQIARLALLDRAQAQEWDQQRLRDEAQQNDYLPYLEEMMTSLRNFLKVRFESLQEEFGQEKTGVYWDLFVSKRGAVDDFTYMTERNIAEEKPLFEIEEGVALCPLINALYIAVLTVLEQKLLASQLRQSFLTRRDNSLEREVKEKLRSFFGETAEFFTKVYETPTLQYEHDLIIRWNRDLFVVEAKASPPIEPFRDPDRAFTRIKRAFQSEKGIQKAFDQANRIWYQLASGDVVNLYDGSGVPAATIHPKDIDRTYCICVTRDDFGPLAVDLSLLMEKDDKAPYPWAVNVLDLEYLLDAWTYFGWGPDKLCNYLDSREKLHGKVFAVDELDVAGFFVKHGGLDHLVNLEGDFVQLTPDYSDVFDRIYEARRGGEEVIYAPKEPFIGDLRKMLADLNQAQAKPTHDTAISRTVKKQGRNEPCACGSGRKYKHCCGRKK